MTEISEPTTEINGAAIEDPATGLAAVVALRRLADRLEDAQVERAMRAGWSWSQAAEALGVTRQAVHKKHARRLIAAGVELRRRDDEETHTRGARSGQAG